MRQAGNCPQFIWLTCREHENSRAHDSLLAPKICWRFDVVVGATRYSLTNSASAQRVHALQRLRIGFAYCSTSIFFNRLTPSRITSPDFSRSDFNNGQRNCSERTLQLNFPHGDSTTISRLRSLGAA